MITLLLVLGMSTAVGAKPAGEPFRNLVGADEGLKDWQAVQTAVRELAERYPDHVRLEVLGHSHEGRAIMALRIADNPNDIARPTILLTAAHHGNEVSTPDHPLDAALQILRNAREEPYATWLRELTLVVVPMVNPDGSHSFWEQSQWTGRKNGRLLADGQRGVDLNRNYPLGWDGRSGRRTKRVTRSACFRGPAPASEPEVQALMRLAHRIRPVGSISYHSANTSLVVPYTMEGLEDPDPATAWRIAAEIIAAMPHRFQNGKKFITRRSLYHVTGIEKDWYHHTFGTMAYVLEAPYRRPRGDQLQESIEHTRGAWRTLFNRWVEGPTLSVQAVDWKGTPVEAVVVIDQVRTRSGERWWTHPETGWFHHYLPKAGKYTVRLLYDGYEVVREVEVGDAPQKLQVTMVPPADYAWQAALAP